MLDYLTYYYYAGMLYCGLKKFERAMECFQMVLSVPSSGVSAVQVEAYKKYILVSLMTNSKLVPLPSRTTSQALRVLDRLVQQPYIMLASAYANARLDAWHTVMLKFQDALAQDKNLGLVKQLTKRLLLTNIQRLSDTYITLSLSSLAEQVRLPSAAVAEAYLMQMINEGMIFASIDQAAGMVSFVDDSEEYDSAQMVRQIDGKIREVVDLSNKLQDKSRALSLDPKYVARTEKSLANKDKGERFDMGMGMNMGMMSSGFGFAGMDEDEDDEQMRLAKMLSRKEM